MPAALSPTWAERTGRTVGYSLASALTLVAVVRAVAPDGHKLVVAVQGVARFLLVPAHPLTLWSAWRGRGRLTRWSAALSLVQVALTVSARGRNRPDPTAVGAMRLRVVSANMPVENPSVDRLAAELATDQADLWALQEVTPQHLAALDRAGVLDSFTHRVLDPQTGYFGSALLSRLPLSDGRVLDLAGSPVTAGRVETPAGPVLVVSVHLLNPGAGAQLGRWRDQLPALGDLVAGSPIPMVLAGDFNATLDHPAPRGLLRAGLRDAFCVAGRALGATWPRWSAPMVPVMRLDHLLVTSEVAVTGFRTLVSAGSDHDRVVADLAVPHTVTARGPGRLSVAPTGRRQGGRTG